MMKNGLEQLHDTLNETEISCSVLFPDDESCPFPGPQLLNLIRHLQKESDDAVFIWNQLYRDIPANKTFTQVLDHAVLSMLARRFPNAAPKTFLGDTNESDGAFYYAHVTRLIRHLQTLLPDAAVLVEKEQGGLPRLIPSARRMTANASIFLRLGAGAIGLELRKLTGEQDIFNSARVFRHKGGVFRPLVLDSIRSVNDFYGYHDARQTFIEHFKQFAEGKSNLPLLISSLPGLGKTQMTIAHTLYYPELTLILPDAEDISTGLEALLHSLEPHKDKRFVLFFDDIDASATDWYSFRANVGGAFNLPEHVTIVISSNQRFPANISSRGRGFVFPIFDEIRCQEMIADCLMSKGMKEPSRDLVSVIASDYVEEFGQKMFEELSPRTLVRYLQSYNSDASKRRKMLENSRNELITEPDAQVFYDENVKLMRSIYGDSILEELRQKEYNGGFS
ncbi:MAG: DUF815 domain-containing protein [Lentisphaeria bacterium]|nr:DUF815 domain-containing protein [Lentisphaeria bacterium]